MINAYEIPRSPFWGLCADRNITMNSDLKNQKEFSNCTEQGEAALAEENKNNVFMPFRVFAKKSNVVRFIKTARSLEQNIQISRAAPLMRAFKSVKI